MAEYTIVDNTGNGGRIKYVVTAGGYISINVVGPGIGQNLAVGQGNQYNSAVALTDAIGDLNVTITRQNNYINSYKTKITDLNSKLNDPNLDPTLREQYKKEIADYQDSIKNSQSNILTAQQAISSLNTIGGSTLQSLIDQAKEANAAAQTAKPVPTSPAGNGTTTTTTGGTTTTTITNSKGSSVNGVASDDSGVKQPNPAGSTGGPKSSPAAAAGAGGATAGTSNTGNKTGSSNSAGSSTPGDAAGTSSTPTNASSGPYQWQSSFVSDQEMVAASRPGKRLQNPLGEFSSYTYQLTLYMITPDAYEAFVATGRTKINVLNEAGASAGSEAISTGAAAKTGAYIVAQSGGVNKNSESRPPGFEFDYGIDDLQFKSIVGGKKAGNPTYITELSFKITEPYGFSFLTNLRKAGDTLFGATAKPNTTNTLRQFFVLGVRFLGYDASGRVMLPNTKMSSGEGIVDPTSVSGSLFEYFIDIKVTSMKFKIDGRAVTYNIKAIQTSSESALKISRGIVKKPIEVTRGNVGDALDDLFTQMNKIETDMANKNPPDLKVPTKYEIVWMPGTEEIYSASIISDTDTDKTHWPGSGATNTSESNVGRETKTQAANDKALLITNNEKQPILQCITNTIMRSAFLETQLNTLYTTDIQSNPDTKSQPTAKKDYQTKTISWYNVTPQISDIKWDDLTNDWGYTIKYLITKYDTPIIDSPLVNSNNLYPGPHKRYEYWYTGENREILQYEQQLDNTYMQVVVGVGDSAIGNTAASSNTASSTNSTGSGVPVQPALQNPMPRYGRTGYGFDPQNSFLTALFDASSFIKAKITIMGDPDLLPAPATYNEQLVYDKYYTGTNGYSLNASGGQVFIEINFKEGVDYVSNTGTMNINESIAFTKYPDNIAKSIKERGGGVVYTLLMVNSTFSGGVFKQNLETILNTFSNADAAKDASGQGREKSQAEKDIEAANARVADEEQAASASWNGQAPPADQGGNNAGTVQDAAPPAPTGNSTAPAANAAPTTAQTAAQPTVQTPTGPVAHGDGVSTNSPPTVPSQGRPK